MTVEYTGLGDESKPRRLFQARRSYASTLPVLLPDPRLGAPHEIAEAVIKLCTDLIGASTGEAEAQVVVEWHPI